MTETTVVRVGRGAWPRDGRGGTISGAGPGPYYAYADLWRTVGLAAVLRFLDGQPIPFDELAVHYGVKAIQRLVNRCELPDDLSVVDGIFGKETDLRVKDVQKRASLKADGVVGSKTMKALLLLPVVETAKRRNEPWEAVWGLLAYEGGWDPGAVGYLDNNDLGLAQVNLKAHPSVTVEQAFDPYWAIEFIAGYLANALTYLNGNVRDAVASYNLGIGGARQWIADGRPDEWLPPWSTTLRYPNKYVDRILNAWKEG